MFFWDVRRFAFGPSSHVDVWQTCGDSCIHRQFSCQRDSSTPRSWTAQAFVLPSVVDASGELKLGSVPGNENPADIGTKRLPVSRMRSLMGVLGIFNVSNGMVEGSDDPGGIFKKKKQNVMAILSALSLLQIQGCEISEPSWGVMMFTAVIGFVILRGLTWVSLFQFGHHPQLQAQQSEVPEPDSEQEPTPPQPPLHIDLPSRNQPTPEGMIIWMTERCLRRRDRCPQRERYNLYNERIQILDNLFQGLTGGDQESRQRGLQMPSNSNCLS